MESHPYPQQQQQQQQKAVSQRSASGQSYVRSGIPQQQLHHRMPWSPPHHHGQSMSMYPAQPNANGHIIYSGSPMTVPPGIIYQQQIALPTSAYPPQQRPNPQFYNSPSIRIMPQQYSYPIYPGQQVQPYYFATNGQQLAQNANVQPACMSPQPGPPRGMSPMPSVPPPGTMGPAVTPQGIVQQPPPPDIRSQNHPPMNTIPPATHIPNPTRTWSSRPSKAVPIVDPKTGKEIIAGEKGIAANSSEKNLNQSKPSNGSSIAEQFHKQVTDAAKESNTTSAESKDNLTLGGSKESLIISPPIQLKSQPEVSAVRIPDKVLEIEYQTEFDRLQVIENIPPPLESKPSIDILTLNDEVIIPMSESFELDSDAMEFSKSIESIPTETSATKVTQQSQRVTSKNHSNRQSKQSRNKTMPRSKESVSKERLSPNSIVFAQQVKQEDVELDEHSPIRPANVTNNPISKKPQLVEIPHISERESTSSVNFNNRNDSNNNSEALKKLAKQAPLDIILPNVDKPSISYPYDITFNQKQTIKPPFGSVPPFADSNKNIVKEPIQQLSIPVTPVIANEEFTNTDVIQPADLDKETRDLLNTTNLTVNNDDDLKTMKDNSIKYTHKIDPNFNFKTETNIENLESQPKTVDETDRANFMDLCSTSISVNKENKVEEPKLELQKSLADEILQSIPVNPIKNDFEILNTFRPVVINKVEGVENNLKSSDKFNKTSNSILTTKSSSLQLNTTDGKLRYDCDFLKSLQNHPGSKCEPNIYDFDGIESVLIKRGGHVSYVMPQRPSEPMPNKNIPPRTAVPKRGSQQGKASLGSNSNMQNLKPGVIHVSLSLHEDVKLNETENAWKPARMRKTVNVSKVDEKNQNVLKEVRGILNKITPQKYDTLVERIKCLDIDTPETLGGVIDLVWEKAIFEPNFATFYASLCKDLGSLGRDNINSKKNFEGLIIDKCQEEFQKDKKLEESPEKQATLKAIRECTNPEKKVELQANFEEEERKERMRSVGNIKFIGELFIKGMLKVRIMMECIKKLLESEEEETLECLCKLLTTIGSVLEETQDLKQYFEKMQAIINKQNSKVNSRVRFMLKDVIELRNNKWVPRRTEAKPKTMDQIQQEADREHMHIQHMNSGSMGPPRKDDKRDGGRRGGRSSNRKEDDWITTQSRNRSNFPEVDSQKLTRLKATNITETKLGPTLGSWFKGSVVKPTASRSMGGAVTPSSFNSNNIFNSLKSADPDNTLYTPSKSASKETSFRGGSVESNASKSQYKEPDSRGSSRSNSSSRSKDRMPVGVPEANIPNPLTDEQIDIKTKRIKCCMEEYFDGSLNIEGVMEEVKEEFQPLHMPVVLECILNIAVEKSSKIHMMVRDITQLMVTLQMITSEQYFECVGSKILSIAPELLLDIPKIYQCLAVLITPHIKDSVCLQAVYRGSDAIIEARQGGTLLGYILKQLELENGADFIRDIWSDSNLELSLWMTSPEIADFVKSNNMDFLGEKRSPNRLQDSIFRLLQQNRSCNDIEKWIDENVAETTDNNFLRALTKSICKDALSPPGQTMESGPRFCSKSTERLNLYSDLLTKYIQHKPESQLQCLFGIQQLLNFYQHPQGATLQLFNHLSEHDIISPEVFLEWEQNGDPHEQEGRGVMIKSLTSFFTILKETSSANDSCDDD